MSNDDSCCVNASRVPLKMYNGNYFSLLNEFSNKCRRRILIMPLKKRILRCFGSALAKSSKDYHSHKRNDEVKSEKRERRRQLERMSKKKLR